MSAWLAAFRIYGRPRLVAVLLMGFSSGLPLPLTLGTLSFWLAELGVSRTTIGLFTLVGLPYSVKFLWSPLLDRLPLPGLTTRLGRRRGWLIPIQALLALAILALGMGDPRAAPTATALAALLVAFLSASQDIVIDAYRIELLRPEEQGAGAAATQWGYRFGMIAASAGALVAATSGGWHAAYAAMAALMGVGMVTVWLTPEPRRAPPPRAGDGTAAWLRSAVVAPFADLVQREGWIAVLLFIVLYKFGDALAGVMSNPLYVALGFSKDEVAAISKLFGVLATLVGIAAGGVAVARLGLYRALLICGVLQMLANLAYAVQVEAGHDVGALAATIAIENFAGGMGSAAFVAYLSRLCNLAFTATQYALLSSLASVGRTTLAASGGWLAERLDWVPFFGLATVACLPGLMLLLWLMRQAGAASFLATSGPPLPRRVGKG